jgi:hypothetical protein
MRTGADFTKTQIRLKSFLKIKFPPKATMYIKKNIKHINIKTQATKNIGFNSTKHQFLQTYSCLNLRFVRKLRPTYVNGGIKSTPGANPTIVSYNASDKNFYNSTSSLVPSAYSLVPSAYSLVRFEAKKSFYFEKTPKPTISLVLYIVVTSEVVGLAPEVESRDELMTPFRLGETFCRFPNFFAGPAE